MAGEAPASDGGVQLAAAQYDVAIIGSGPGGYVAAIRAGQLGLKTLLIEKDAHFGGTCLHVGCIPTKALLFDAEVYDHFKNADKFGIACKGFSVEWPLVLERKSTLVKRLAKGIEFLLKKNRVETLQGFARLAGPGRIVVTTPREQAQEITARNIVLATGSEAKMLPGIEADRETILTNKEILDLKDVPKSITVIGAGAVGVEFASVFHRFGTKVTVLEMLPRAVPLEDEEVSAELERSFRKQGIAVQTQARVEKVSKTAKGVSVEYATPDGKAHHLDSETLLVAVGRAPNTQGIGLEKTRAKVERGFIKVNSNMQTDEPGLYAIGDVVADSPLLAHVAEAEGIVAVTHAAGRPVEPINYHQIPNCTYCEPEISSVGLSERQAREAGPASAGRGEAGHTVRVGKFPLSANSKAGILGAREGFVKIVSADPYGEILGVHMIGPRVTELIAEAVVAMRLEGTVDDLSHTIHPHPTLTEAVLEAAEAAHGMAIHI